MSIFSKNDSIEYKKLDDYAHFIDELLSLDEYISRKNYFNRKDELSKIIDEFKLMDEKGVLVNWCKNNKTDYKKLNILIKSYNDTDKLIKKHNEDYVNNHLKSDKQYLDDVLKKDDPNIKLDEDQRRVVLSDEDYTLVIAGAGAGKTTTIEAKVKYLVDVKNINPDRVLIVSFTRKATQELKERFARLELPVNIATFHSIGNTIIKKNDGVKHRIVETGFMYRTIEEYLINKLDEEIGYGMFKDKESYFIPKVISILMDLNVLNKFKNEKVYENINLNQNTLADSQVLILEQQFY